MEDNNCGCKFSKDEHGNIIYVPKFNAPNQVIDLECPLVWELFRTGNTKGIFQLESNLGRGKSKEVAPTNIMELADLISIIRPGSAEALLEDGKSVTWHYIQRKAGKEDVSYFHPALEAALKNTYGLLIYQEQALAIAKDIGGFSMEEAEVLRKAIGKKKADIMAEMKKLFVTKAEAHGVVNKEEAEEIFSWIEASQRYSFNACLNPNTLVYTQNYLYKTIEELNIGEYILAPKSDLSGDEFVKVIDKFDNGEKDVYEITLESGKKIESTLDHKFLCEDNIIRPLYEILNNGHSIICEDE